MPRPSHLIITLLLMGIAVLIFYMSVSKQEATVIRLHDDQIDIQKLSNEIARFILTKGYGYQVRLVESTIKEVHDHLMAGDIDVTLEMWKGNNLAWFDMARQKGEVVDLGTIYTGGRQYWIIPRWYAREKNIRTVFDMKEHWRDFTNPEDPSKGLFFNCIFGWSCRDINRVKLRAYGLDRYYNTVPPTSPEALESIYENALTHNLPVFGYYWEPNALVASQDWYALEEPSYSDAIWEKIIRAATNADVPCPESACAFKEIGVHKLANRLLLDKAPDAAKMLKKMKLDYRIFNEILFSETGPKNFEQMAITFFTAYPAQWQAWVSGPATKKINKALAENQSIAEKKTEN